MTENGILIITDPEATNLNKSEMSTCPKTKSLHKRRWRNFKAWGTGRKFLDMKNLRAKKTHQIHDALCSVSRQVCVNANQLMI